ncbi:MAG: SRPBCC domain-containing protein [Candidatus Rokubacteria bacterium]|nr:SRPBCC domain-containing protein [Candidatus Rokubacteria bacterium]
MPDLHHEIAIQATPQTVYDALTTTPGLGGWWTSDSSAEPRVGSIATFGFGRRSTVFRMRVDELVPGRRIVWQCLGDVDEWKDTRLTWDIAPDSGGVKLKFVHGGWRSTDGWLAPCNSTWGALMHRLRDYAEGRNPGPHFHA